MLIYDTLEQARMRLRGSIITYRDQAVSVIDAKQKSDGSLHLQLRPFPLVGEGSTLSKQNIMELPIGDPDLNFRVFRLGYMNCSRNKTCGFLSRQTRRQQSQGVVFNTLSGIREGNISDYSLQGKDFEDMLFQRYPSVDEAFKRINDEGWSSVAIGRYFALARDADIKLLQSLMYRGRRVGVALGNKFTEFLIDERDTYLAEVLREAGFPFRTE